MCICILQINVTSGNSERKCGDCGNSKDSRSMLQTNHKGKDKEGGVYYTKIMNGTDTHTHQTEGPPGSGSSFKWLWSMGENYEKGSHNLFRGRENGV